MIDNTRLSALYDRTIRCCTRHELGSLDMKKILILAAIVLTVMTSCHGGLKMNVGLWGEMLDDNMMTLAGDTFVVHGKIGDNMLIVSDYEHPDDAEPYYLLQQKPNGHYYPMMKAKEMHFIDNTTDFIGLDKCNIYDIKHKKVVFKSPCQVEDLSYVGKWENKLLFASYDTICFSDGRCLGLQKNVYYEAPKNGKMLTLVDGAQKINVSFAELYDITKGKVTRSDKTEERLKHDYFIKPRNEYESDEVGFRVDLDVPKGNTKAEQAIRQWMIDAIAKDVFSLLGEAFPTSNSKTYNEIKSSLDKYGTLWEKLCRAEYQDGDALMVSLNCDIKVDKVADCDDYTTYHYWANLYNGGLHEIPHAYYITYDKRRDCLLNVTNSVKPQAMQQFRKLVLKSLKSERDLKYEEGISWEDFTESIFSFHCPMIETKGMSKESKSLLEHNYTCDEWAGWNGYNEVAFTEKDFPLTHFAILPEGIVLTYHPYQIDCFNAGEYHAVIPFKEAAPYLTFDYSNHEDLKARLNRFVK